MDSDSRRMDLNAAEWTRIATPENAAEAVSQVAPFGLDVSSGVEVSPGKKDVEKVTQLIANAKNPSSLCGLWTNQHPHPQ